MRNTAVLIKILVILLHLWEDIPPLKSSTASSTWRTLTKATRWPLVAQLRLLCTPPNPLASLPGCWNRAGIDGTAGGERLQKCKGTGAVYTAGSHPVLWHHHSNGCRYHLFLLQKRHRPGLILFHCLSDLPWTALNTWQKQAFGKLIFKISGCNAVTIAFKQKGIRSSLEEERMMLAEEKENLTMAEGKRCFSDTIPILPWVLLFNGLVA